MDIYEERFPRDQCQELFSVFSARDFHQFACTVSCCLFLLRSKFDKFTMVDPLGESQEEVSVESWTMISKALFLLQQREAGFLHERELKVWDDVGIESVSRGTHLEAAFGNQGSAVEYCTVDIPLAFL